MAKTAGAVTKIYELRTLGYADISKQLDNIAKKFDTIKKSKLSAQGKMALTNDVVEIKRYSDEIEKLILEEQQLRVETQRLTNEQKAANLQRQADIDLQKKKRAANIGEAGSISEVRKQIKDLNAALILKNQSGGGLINFNGAVLSIDQATAKLKQLITVEQDFRRQFARDGLLVAEYTSGIVQAFKQMGLGDLVGGQINKAQEHLNELNKDFDRLQKELEETKKAGNSTETIERQMIENRKEVIALGGTLKNLRADLTGVGGVGASITNSITNGFKSLKGQVSSFALQYIGLSAIISKTQAGISEAKLSSDQSTDLEIQLGGTADEADRLNKALLALNTRTTLTGLQNIADVALKAGAGKENIVEVTKAIDILKGGFGKDFGSIEEGTETIVKLINIFFEDGQITGERILQIGNSIRSLANETVASVPFLTDFSGRMAGVKQIANITLPDIIGLGAGFQEFKQSAEVASMVLVKVIPKLAQDTEKFAGIIGVTREEFIQLLNDNPAEALIRVSEALVKSGKGITEVSEALADSELGSGRITTIIATLGGKADIFRERIARAGETIQQTGAITDAFQKKNTNLAATMDRTNKKFQDFFASKGFQTVLAAIAGLLILIIGNLPILIGLVGLLTVSWAAQNITLIGLRAQIILYNLGIGANLVLINVLRVANLAYTAGLFIMNGALRVITAGMRLFGITTASATGPLGIILTIVALLGGALLGLSKAMGNGVKNLEAQNRELKIMAEIQIKATQATAAQIGTINSWITVIKSSATSADTKRKALENLIKIDEKFKDALSGDVILLDKLKEAYDAVTKAIYDQAKAKASAQLTAEKQQRVNELVLIRQTLETQAALGQPFKLPGTQQGVLSKLLNQAGVITGGDVHTDFNALIKQKFSAIIGALKKEEQAALDEFQAYFEVQSKIEREIDQKLLKEQGGVFAQFEKLVKSGGTDAEFEKLLQQVTEQRKKANRLTKDYKDLVALEKKINDLINPKDKSTTTFKGSKLTGTQKDDFKDIDAERDRLIAEDKQSFEERQLDEETYLTNVFEFNRLAINKKLKLLKGANAEERKQIAELNLEKVELEKKLNDDLFERRAKILKDNLDTTVKNAQEQADKVVSDPNVNVTETARTQAQLDADKKILAAQIFFNQEMDKLEKNRNVLSKKNAEDRARDRRNAEKQITDDEKKLIVSEIEDLKKTGERTLAEFELTIDKAILVTQADSTLSKSQKNARIRILENERTFGVLVRQAEQYKKLEVVFKKALDAGIITLAQYEEIVKKLLELQKQISESPETRGKGFFDGIKIQFGEGIEGFLTRAAKEFGSRIKKIFGKELSQDQSDALGGALADAIAQSYSLAQEVMNGFFDAERDRIQQNLDLQLERLDLEKEQVIARAQSQAEINSIEKQYADKKKEAEAKAHEDLKRAKRSEAKIALATELANIWSSVWQLGPIAGPILGAIFSGLALGRYALRVNEINREKFERGGVPKDTGGKIEGPTHASGGVPFNYEAEGGELAIVNKKSVKDNKVRTLTGTNKQIASMINQLGGGVSFAKGAKVVKFESGGYLGDSLQPPVFNPSMGIIGRNDNTEVIDAIQEQTTALTKMAEEQSKRIDRIQTFVSEKDISDSQKKRAKQTSIGTM